MRIVVTGASGFIGRRVVAALAAEGHAVVAASRSPVALSDPVEWRQSPDLGANADWSYVLANAEAVVHSAARVHVMSERAADPLAEFRKVNVDGTIALARQAIEAGVRRFIFISSIKVNGETTTGRAPFTPADLPAPVDPYGISKWEAERALDEIGAAAGMETAAIRPVLVHGAGVAGNMATLGRIAAQGWPIPLGAVKNRRSLVHVDNLADFVARVVAFPRPIPPVMLVRDDGTPSTADLVRGLARGAGRAARLPAVPVGLLSAAARLLGRSAWIDRLLGSLEVDDAATREALNWTPLLALSEGLAQTTATIHPPPTPDTP